MKITGRQKVKRNLALTEDGSWWQKDFSVHWQMTTGSFRKKITKKKQDIDTKNEVIEENKKKEAEIKKKQKEKKCYKFI